MLSTSSLLSKSLRNATGLVLFVSVNIPLLLVFAPTSARAELPTGYMVWSKGDNAKPQTRKIYRMTLPGKTDVIPLTSGEDIESRVSPDGKWVAYAKAKLAGVGSSYHDFNLWKVYIVSIHGVGPGREEIKIDDDGYWPSWGNMEGDNYVLYYNQIDGDAKHTKIMKITFDAKAKLGNKNRGLCHAVGF